MNDATDTAGIVSRGLAALVVGAVVAATMGMLYLGLALTLFLLRPTAFRFPAPHLVFSTALAVTVAVGYLGLFWTLSGRTVGAVVLGVRVVGRDGGPLRPPAALLRAVACVLFPIGLLWVAWDARRRSVQDLLLGSRVVYAR